MQQLAGIWQGLDLRRRIIAVLATVGTFAAVLALAGFASRPSMALLYAGLDGAASGAVLAALDQRGAAYEIRGDAIYVDSAERDVLRMALAGEGLPQAGGTGYELLDTLTGFGTTSEMFDAAYWRAKEGELARTITANPSIRSARVHISNQELRGLRPTATPKASVTVTTAGGGLSAPQAKALKHLVASAVAGMTPDDVSVIDSAAGLISTGDEAPGAQGDDRAAELRQGVERLLEARVGYGNAVVEVSLETVNESEAVTERRFDPDNRVAISTDTEERTTSSTDSRGSAVTVASNLPDGDAAGGGGASESRNSETRERVNFEVSETTREILRTPGAVKRLTVAVLVDGVEGVDANGAPSMTPRPAEELAALRDLVAAAVGFDEARGDVITIDSMPFEPAAEAGTAAADGMLQSLDLMMLAQLVTLAVVALALGLFVLRPVLLRPPPVALPAPGPGPASSLAPASVLTGEIDEGDFVPPNMAVVSDFGTGLPDRLPAFAAPAGEGDAVARLRRLVAERQGEAMAILRNWIGEPKEDRA